MFPVLSRIVLCILLLFSIPATFGQGAKLSGDGRGGLAGEKDDPDARSRWFLEGRTINGQPGSRQLLRAYQQKLNNRSHHAQPRAGTSIETETAESSLGAQPRPTFVQSSGGPAWVPLGPAPAATASIGDLQQDYGPAIGRATVVVVDQGDPSGNTVYLGGAAGGLWRSTNAAHPIVAPCPGSTAPYCAPSVQWTPLIDQQATLTVGTLALQPGNSNVILVGTGEANNSADSYYGLGILRSADAGVTWSLITSAVCPAQNSLCAATPGTISFHGLGFTHLAFSADNPNLVVATTAAANGGVTVGAESSGSDARGIYYSLDAGVNWTRASVSDGNGFSPQPGSSDALVYNPAQRRFYANIRWHGLYSSSDGANWTRLTVQPSGTSPALDLSLVACPSVTLNTCAMYRAELAVTPDGQRMYVVVVDVNDGNRGIYQTQNGGVSWTALSVSGIEDCGDGPGAGCGTTQGIYNLTLAAVPNGVSGTDVYAGAVNTYKCTIDPVLNPTCVAKPFANLTHVYGNCGSGVVGGFSHVHADQHGIDFSHANPRIVYFANDGGIYRTLNGFTLGQGSCNGAQQQQVQFDNLSGTMGSMMQFVSFSHHPSDPTVLLGGTHGNGSPAKDSTAAPGQFGFAWQSANKGDGGFTDINPVKPQEWFTSNPRLNPGIQQCVNNGGITCASSTFSPVIAQSTVGNDAASFYTPYLLDPQSSNHMLVGTCRLWRVDRPASDTGPWTVAAALSNNFETQDGTVCAKNALNMVSAIAAGGPCNGSCNPGANGGAPLGGGSQVMYAGTDRGQIFVSTNSDNGPATWINRSAGLSNANSFPISSIAIDPQDTTGRTAYATVMGFGTGHVFKTSDAGANWTKLDGDPAGTGLPDSPADAVVVDPIQPDLIYVGTDMGVFSSRGDSTWTEVGASNGTASLPSVAITALKIFRNGTDVRLRASTYGRGIWEIPVSTQPGFNATISNPAQSVMVGQPATFNGTLNTFNGYGDSINFACRAISGPVPSTCLANPATTTNPAASQPFTVTASNESTGEFNFYVEAKGTDASTVTQQVPVRLRVVDFSLGAPNPSALTLGHSTSGPVGLTLQSLAGFEGSVTLSCSGSGQPAGITCSFPGSNPVVLGPGASTNFTINVAVDGSVAPASYAVSISASSGGVTHTQTVGITVILNTTFILTAGPSVTVKATQTAQQSVTVSSQDGYAGLVNLTSALSGVSMTPAQITSLPATSTLYIPTTASQSGLLSVMVTGVDSVDGSKSNSVSVPYRVANYAITGANAIAVPGGSASIALNIAGQNGYAGTIAISCDNHTVPASTCVLNPPGSFTVGAASMAATAVVSVPAGTAGGDYTIIINSHDNDVVALAHAFTATVAVQDYSLSTTPSSATTRAGQSSPPMTVKVNGGLSGTVAFSCSAGMPALSQCSFSPATVDISAGQLSTTLTISTTAASVSQLRPAIDFPPVYAIWFAVPMLGIFGSSLRTQSRARRRSNIILTAGALIFLGILLQACGGGGDGSTTTPPIPRAGTPAGTYTITVTGTSGTGATALSRSTTVTLTVQ